MTLLNRYKRNIQQYLGSRNVQPHRTGVISDLANPSSTGLFFCVENKTQLNEIRKLVRAIRSKKEKTMAFVFSHEQEKIDVITDHSLFYFDLDDFTLFGKMKEAVKEAFEKEHFELMISFLSNPDPFCYKLVSEIKAEFKVGPDHPDLTGIYDLTLNFDLQKKGYIRFYEHARHYLSVLNIKTR